MNCSRLAISSVFSFFNINSKLTIKLEIANKNWKGRICDANSGFWGDRRKKGKKIKHPDFPDFHLIPFLSI